MTKTEKIIIVVTALFICFTAGFFVGKSVSRNVMTFSQADDSGGAGASAAPSGQNTAADTGVPLLPSPPGDTTGGTTVTQTAASLSPEAAGRININTASAAQLDSLPGIGEVLARRIIEYRQQNGDFQKPEDIMNVSGIGQSKYDDIKDMITVS
jgi:competence protein ComEA